MAGRRRDLSAEERALWDRVAASARPLGRLIPRQIPDVEELASSAKGSINELPPPPTGVAEPKRTAAGKSPLPLSGLDRRTEQKLRRGAIEVDARLDLHGMTQTHAHGALRRFLQSAQERGWRVVLVITGKGGSPLTRGGDAISGEERGALARHTPHWLEAADMRPLVSGFRAAHPRHGGTGALYVRIRRAR